MTTRVSRKDTIGPIEKPKNRRGNERHSSLCKNTRNKIYPWSHIDPLRLSSVNARGIIIFRERLFRKSQRTILNFAVEKKKGFISVKKYSSIFCVPS